MKIKWPQFPRSQDRLWSDLGFFCETNPDHRPAFTFLPSLRLDG